MFSSLSLNHLTAYVFCATMRFSPPSLREGEENKPEVSGTLLVTYIYSPKDEPAGCHGDETAEETSQGENQLTQADKGAENESANPDPKHPVQEIAPKHRNSHIGPVIERVEQLILSSVNT